MAGLAFTAYGIHWFAMAYRRYIGSSDGCSSFSLYFLLRMEQTMDNWDEALKHLVPSGKP